jgi:hypothetical protein
MVRAAPIVAEEYAERLLREAERCFQLAMEMASDDQIVQLLEALGRLMRQRALDVGKARSS